MCSVQGLKRGGFVIARKLLVVLESSSRLSRMPWSCRGSVDRPVRRNCLPGEVPHEEPKQAAMSRESHTHGGDMLQGQAQHVYTPVGSQAKTSESEESTALRRKARSRKRCRIVELFVPSLL